MQGVANASVDMKEIIFAQALVFGEKKFSGILLDERSRRCVQSRNSRMEIGGIALLNASMALQRRHITLISSSRRGRTADIKRVLTSWMSCCRAERRNDGSRCQIATDGGKSGAGIVKTSVFGFFLSRNFSKWKSLYMCK